MTTKFYVTMTDKFMSGWGQAQGKVNKLVISCNSLDEALTVERNAQRRGEMKHVNIRNTRPSYPNALVSWHGRDQGDYESWFTDHNDWQ